MQPCSTNVAELSGRPYRKGRWFYFFDFSAELVWLAHVLTSAGSQAPSLGSTQPSQHFQTLSSLTGRTRDAAWGPLFTSLGVLDWWSCSGFFMYPLLVVNYYTLSSRLPLYLSSGIIKVYSLSFAFFSGCFQAPLLFFSHLFLCSPLFSRTEKLHTYLA